MLDLVQHGNGKRIARSCSSVLSCSRLISFLLVLLVCDPPTILLLLVAALALGLARALARARARIRARALALARARARQE